MELRKIRSLSAELLGVGETRIWINPEKIEEIRKCITKDDVRAKIKEGAIKKRKFAQISRSHAKALHKKKKLGRKRGFGKRKAGRKRRAELRKSWISNVRAQRKKIRELRKSGVIDKKSHAKLYRMVKGGYFRGKRYIEAFVKEKKPG